MATMDIFNNEAFRMTELVEGINNAVYEPTFIAGMNLFQTKSLYTDKFSIEQKDNKLSLVSTSERGAPLEQNTQLKRNIRDFRTTRVGKADTILASELFNVRAFGKETELQAVQGLVAERMEQLRTDINLTMENMMLGAIQGKVLDADGSVINDWFSEWSITPRVQAVDLTAGAADGLLRDTLNKLTREIARNSNGSFTAQTRMILMAGDNFYDDFLKLKEIQDLFANNLGANASRIPGGEAFGSIDIPHTSWTIVNYRGTDDNTSVKINDNEAFGIPVNTLNSFYKMLAPGETFAAVGSKGQEFYPEIITDVRDRFVEIELITYPSFCVTKPALLTKFTMV